MKKRDATFSCVIVTPTHTAIFHIELYTEIICRPPHIKQLQPLLQYNCYKVHTKVKLLVRDEYYLIRTMIYQNDEMTVYLLLGILFCEKFVEYIIPICRS